MRLLERIRGWVCPKMSRADREEIIGELEEAFQDQVREEVRLQRELTRDTDRHAGALQMLRLLLEAEAIHHGVAPDVEAWLEERRHSGGVMGLLISGVQLYPLPWPEDDEEGLRTSILLDPHDVAAVRFVLGASLQLHGPLAYRRHQERVTRILAEADSRLEALRELEKDPRPPPEERAPEEQAS